MILESVKHSPLIWPTIEKNRVTKIKKYVELSAIEKLQADCDMKAINIILQGLPTEIYSLVNHHRVAKDLWEKVQLIMQDPGIAKGPVTQSVITHKVAYQVDDLDAYDSDYDEISTAKAVLMTNLSSYESDVLSEVLIFDNTHNDMLNQSVQEMPYSESSNFLEHSENEIHSDSNIIPYSQYIIESQTAAVHDTNSSSQQDALILSLERYKERVKLLEERQNVDLDTQEKLIIDDIIQEKNAQFADFEKEINNLKQTLFEQKKEKELLTKIFNVFKNESKEKEAKNIDIEISLEKKVKELDNIVSLGFQNPFYLKKAQQIRPMLYDSNVIAKETNVISIAHSKETLKLEEESRSKMLFKTNIKNNLSKLKGKDTVDNAVQMSNATIMAPGMYKLDQIILAPRVKNNRETHEYYLKHTMEQADILRELIQELLSYVRDTCPNIHKPSEKLVMVMPINKKNTVRFADTAASSSNMPKVTNRPLLSSTGVKPSTSASGSKPSGNTKNDRILRTPSSNEKNKVEVQSRKVKSKITTTNKVPLRVSIPLEVVTPEHVVTKVYTRRPKVPKYVPNSKPKVAKSMTANRMEPSTSRGSDTSVAPSYSSLIDCSNDQVAKIMGYGDYQIGNVTISRFYYVEGLGHNLFLVGQFCNSDLEVAFKKHTCFVRNQEGVDLLLGSRGTTLYSLSIGDMMASSPICLLSIAIKTKSWLWHRRMSHFNFGVINHLARHGLVRGLPRIKFEKDHLCFACAMGKIKKQSHKPKSEDTNQEKLHLFHMDLCGPMRIASVNGKKYILFIVDDYFQFTWVKFLASKDEAPNFIIKFLKMIQVRLNAAVRNIRTDNGTEFAEAVATSCYTQNRSIIQRPHGKPPYELLHDRKPNLSYLHLFGALCYPNNDSENLGKLQAKDDIVFDEFYSPPASVASPVPVEEAPAPVESTIETKTYKEALTHSCWIEAMQEGLNEFKCLKVWELVPPPDKVMVITLK
ncbi:retrovirus-related pol polyprotein from transposon TNT 1-94 [Tanacetum coccineum]